MPRVDSSAILRIHYDAPTRALDITYVEGRLYRYFDVPPELYAQFLDAPSKGKFANQHVIGKFRFEDLTSGWR